MSQDPNQWEAVEPGTTPKETAGWILEEPSRPESPGVVPPQVDPGAASRTRGLVWALGTTIVSTLTLFHGLGQFENPQRGPRDYLFTLFLCLLVVLLAWQTQHRRRPMQLRGRLPWVWPAAAGGSLFLYAVGSSLPYREGAYAWGASAALLSVVAIVVAWIPAPRMDSFRRSPFGAPRRARLITSILLVALFLWAIGVDVADESVESAGNANTRPSGGLPTLSISGPGESSTAVSTSSGQPPTARDGFEFTIESFTCTLTKKENDPGTGYRRWEWAFTLGGTIAGPIGTRLGLSLYTHDNNNSYPLMYTSNDLTRTTSPDWSSDARTIERRDGQAASTTWVQTGWTMWASDMGGSDTGPVPVESRGSAFEGSDGSPRSVRWTHCAM